MGAEKYVAAYRLTRAEVRTLLYNRQNGLCGICEDDLPKGFLHSQHVNIDHVRPRACGGPDIIDNLQLTHRSCNLDKGASCAGCEGCLRPIEEDCQ